MLRYEAGQWSLFSEVQPVRARIVRNMVRSQEQPQPLEQSPGQWNDLAMLTPDEGWAVGQAGAMAHYQNGQWQVMSPVTEQDLRAISLVDAETGWAIGEGLVLRYQGGLWQEVAAPLEAISLRMLAAMSAEEVWLMGTQRIDRFDSGVALHYQNGTWQVVDIPMAYPTALKLLNEREGWAVGDGIIQFTDAP